jgi:DNA-binding NarL/FixJ family response regulator
MDRKTNIIIIEENRLYRESLRLALSQINDFNIVLDGDTIDDIARISAVQFIDLVLLSIDVGKVNGHDPLMQLRRRFPQLKILVLLDYPETCYYENAISEGANDAISKFSSKRTIEHHLRSILKVNENLQNEINIQSTTNN